jgi:hypothetical protein
MAARPSTPPNPHHCEHAGTAAADASASAADVIACWAPYLRIAHQVPGRVRLRLAAALADAPELRRFDPAVLQRVLGEASGLRNVRLNPLARSCVVEYDDKLIPDAAWADLLAGRDTPAARILTARLGAGAHAADAQPFRPEEEMP